MPLSKVLKMAQQFWSPERPSRRKIGDEYKVKFVFEMTFFGFDLPWPYVREEYKKVGEMAEVERKMLRILAGELEGSTQYKVGFVSFFFLVWVYRTKAKFYDLIFGSQIDLYKIQYTALEDFFIQAIGGISYGEDVLIRIFITLVQ